MVTNNNKKCPQGSQGRTEVENSYSKMGVFISYSASLEYLRVAEWLAGD